MRLEKVPRKVCSDVHPSDLAANDLRPLKANIRSSQDALMISRGTATHNASSQLVTGGNDTATASPQTPGTHAVRFPVTALKSTASQFVNKDLFERRRAAMTPVSFFTMAHRSNSTQARGDNITNSSTELLSARMAPL